MAHRDSAHNIARDQGPSDDEPAGGFSRHNEGLDQRCLSDPLDPAGRPLGGLLPAIRPSRQIPVAISLGTCPDQRGDDWAEGSEHPRDMVA